MMAILVFAYNGVTDYILRHGVSWQAAKSTSLNLKNVLMADGNAGRSMAMPKMWIFRAQRA
jgi:hypothetical protein